MRMRAVLTKDVKFAVWADNSWSSHAEFESDTGMTGVRLIIDHNTVLINDETVALPHLYSWLYPDDVDELDIDERRRIVETFILSCNQAQAICPPGCRFGWYS
jgi:hypothetical protein